MDDRQEFFNQAMARAVKPIDSHANFVMMNTFHPAEDVIQYLRRNNILVGRSFPAMRTYIRISLGRPDEMRRFWAGVGHAALSETDDATLKIPGFGSSAKSVRVSHGRMFSEQFIARNS